MKHSLKHGAGYLIIDHTNSPGTRAVGEGQIFERDILVCSHCERTIVLHPLRTRDRGYCPKCHAFICDACEEMRARAGGSCVPMKQVLDRAEEVAEKVVLTDA